MRGPNWWIAAPKKLAASKAKQGSRVTFCARHCKDFANSRLEKSPHRKHALHRHMQMIERA
jgi:hypothetical protein